MKALNKLFYDKRKMGFVFSLPGILLLLSFVVLPFVLAIGYSLTNRTLVVNPVTGTEFIGLENYKQLFQDKSFFVSIKNTLSKIKKYWYLSDLVFFTCSHSNDCCFDYMVINVCAYGRRFNKLSYSICNIWKS